MYSFGYQYTLIAMGVAATILFAVFLNREISPEYKIYQNDYIALENFRSSFSHEPPPAFQTGIKQIVFERKDNGPASIERCISCHVALDIPYFSPTKLDKDVNGNIALDDSGMPVQIPNEDYIWSKLEQTDPKLYLKLSTAKVGDLTYNVTKVLRMHPLIGRETRPFEYHPLNEYGCVSCHNGNGQGLTTEKAHGPVFDGQYDIEYEGPEPEFTERDPLNDPSFASQFNHKPGNSLIFQTTPIFVGPLVQAKCMACHRSSSQELNEVMDLTGTVASRRQKQSNSIQLSFDQEVDTLEALLKIRGSLEKEGYAKTLELYSLLAKDYSQPEVKRHAYEANLAFLQQSNNKENALADIDKQVQSRIGSKKLANELYTNPTPLVEFIDKNSQSSEAKGSVFEKYAALNLEKAILRHVNDTANSFEKTLSDPSVVTSMTSEIDLMTSNFHRGEQLFLSQACYACHKIAGFSRGGVGPELTREGTAYPWFVKQSIVWPQADLPTSTMPNYRLDHEELQDLVTYLLGQVGENRAISPTRYFAQVQEWEAGKKKSWEKPVTPIQMQDVKYGMKVFATEGCSACHRLKGFESDVGFKIEKDNKPDFDTLYKEREWFKRIVPEQVVGSSLVKIIEENSKEIDERIINGVRQGSILEEIDQILPGQIESLYTDFKYASRIKNHELHNNPEELEKWKDRVHRVLMIYIQEYGLGRLIGPRPNWAGVYRSDEWLMEHFKNPSLHVARSIMPVMPFDDTKFYALTHMLDVLGKENRDSVREIWNHYGFNPEMAYQIHCAQCHGEYKQGNGPVSTWIYPVPKNLNNADFLRNLTRDRVILSITHGVGGTPMPPWGEVGSNKPDLKQIPVLNESEIKQLADWIFSSLPGGQVIKSTKDVQKWQYTPEDVIRELQQEGNQLRSSLLYSLPDGKGLLASIQPMLDQSQDIFEAEANPVPGEDPWNYYIKKKYYTPENLAAGQAFFEMNCAVCHGKEADGSGARAQMMKDAKPRMLVNLDWIKSRDDLRLLRSIKYGVPGTSMTPWGDLTSSLQRLQLVMFIRSLSKEKLYRDQLSSALFKAYDHAIIAVEQARVHEYAPLAKADQEYDNLRKERESQSNAADRIESKEILGVYQKELEASINLQKLNKVDQILLNLRNEIRKEKDLYQKLGLLILNSELADKQFPLILKVIESNPDRFQYHDDKLQYNPPNNDRESFQEILNSISNRVESSKKDRTIIEGKIASVERANELRELQNQIDSYTKLQYNLTSTFEEAQRSRQKQKSLYESLYNSKQNSVLDRSTTPSKKQSST